METIGVFMGLLQEFETEIESFKAEFSKFQRGNKSAGTRARKHLQSVKKIAQDLRNTIQDTKQETATEQETAPSKQG